MKLFLLLVAVALPLTGYSSSTAVKAAAPMGVSQEKIQAHALAFGAILSTTQQQPLTSLKETVSPEEEQKRLANSWNVHSREELLTLLQDMESGKNGHRGSFQTILLTLRVVPAEGLLDAMTKRSSDRAELERHLVAATYLHAAPSRTLELTAWDFGRYINLCRWGCGAGYLSEAEAWEKILPVARYLQVSYDSWQEYAVDYMRGREFWSAAEMRESGLDVRRAAVGLLQAPKGLWTVIPWDESLGAGPVAVDKLPRQSNEVRYSPLIPLMLAPVLVQSVPVRGSVAPVLPAAPAAQEFGVLPPNFEEIIREQMTQLGTFDSRSDYAFAKPRPGFVTDRSPRGEARHYGWIVAVTGTPRPKPANYAGPRQFYFMFAEGQAGDITAAFAQRMAGFVDPSTPAAKTN